MMNAANITASMAAATFSARRRSQSQSLSGTPLFQRVDLLEHPLWPVLRFVGSEVDLLRMRAERVLVGGIDLQPCFAELLRQLFLALQVLGGAPGDGFVRRRLEGFLLGRRHRVPRLEVVRQQ